MARGRFITFEGIDGSGKSTAIKAAAEALKSKGIPVITTREETEGPTGEWIRRSIAEKWDPLATTFLFLADRAQHAKQIEAWLVEGKTVLCDRYMHSTLAYQGVTLAGQVTDADAMLRRLHEPWAPKPDHVVLFVADPKKCVERTARRGATAPYEKVDFLAKVQAKYKAVTKGDSTVHLLDAERPMPVVAKEAAGLVTAWLSAAP